MFRPENIPAFAAAYLDGAPAADPRASPVYAELPGLPPLLLQVGSTELLLDDACHVHERVVVAGSRSRLTLYDDVLHRWHLLAPLVPEARAALREVAEFVRAHLGASAESTTLRHDGVAHLLRCTDRGARCSRRSCARRLLGRRNQPAHHTPSVDAIRATTVGHLILGSSFDPRDPAAYAGGVLLALVLERAAGLPRQAAVEGGVCSAPRAPLR